MPGIASSAPAVMIGAVAGRDARHPRRLGRRDAAQPRRRWWSPSSSARWPRCTRDASTSASAARPAPTSSPPRRCAARPRPAADDFPEQLGELGALPRRRMARRAPVRPHPRRARTRAQPPVIWLLGSSLYSAELAGLLGMPFAFAHHFSSANTLPALAAATARASGRTASWTSRTRWSPCTVMCAPTDEEADRIALPQRCRSCACGRADPGRCPVPRRPPPTRGPPLEREFVAQRREGQAIGSPETVREAAGRRARGDPGGRADDHHAGARTADRLRSTRTRPRTGRRPTPWTRTMEQQHGR